MTSFLFPALSRAANTCRLAGGPHLPLGGHERKSKDKAAAPRLDPERLDRPLVPGLFRVSQKVGATEH